MEVDEIMTLRPMEGKIESIMGALNRYCLHIAREGWDAEDLVQETWARALTVSRTERLQQHSNPEAWMLRVAKNIWTDQGRRRQVLGRLLEQLSHDSAILQSQAALEAEPRSSETLELMFAALMKHLTPLQRTVFLLRDVYGYSASETAVRLGLSEGAVKAALHRARKGLLSVRKELAGDGASLPAEENWRAILRAIVLAYASGNIDAVVGLLARDLHEPVAAIGILPVSSRRTGPGAVNPTANMAA
jgi:RNA polymerase sigma factor (sigma-70 family)